MSAGRLAAVYGAMLAAFFALDMLWLGVLARGFYARQLGDLMRPDIRWGAAVGFYLVYLLGVLVLVVLPAVESQSLQRALLNGALLGLVAYAAYDLTNLATLQGFPTRLVPVDLVWGTVLTAAIAGVGWWVGRTG